jgi:phospholipid/cholesterol/gamma-HCH transport system ATP-binding protein
MSTAVAAADRTPVASPRGETIVEFENVWKRYSGRDVLTGVNLTIRRGEVLCILGPSGTGKSVALRHINGLTQPDDGDVRVFGSSVVGLTEEELSPVRRRVAMLFQGGALFDSMNVEQNIAFPVREHGERPPEEIAAIVAEKLTMVGLPGVQRKMPAELSGGMRKRVAIARALVIHPELILYDEPTADLDPILTEQIGQLIARLRTDRGRTQIIVTHNLALARGIADRIAVLAEGRIVESLPPAELLHGRHPLTREFVRASGLAA